MGSLRTSREARLKIKGGGVREDRGNASATLHVRPFGVDGSCYDVGIATRVSRPTPKSLQQVLDPRFELFGIVGPVAIDFQAMGSDSPALRSAPLTQCLVHGSKFLVGPTMNDYCRFARRRRHAGDIAIANERSDHLDAKIHPHDGRIFMMIENDIVSIDPTPGGL